MERPCCIQWLFLHSFFFVIKYKPPKKNPPGLRKLTGSFSQFEHTQRIQKTFNCFTESEIYRVKYLQAYVIIKNKQIKIKKTIV